MLVTTSRYSSSNTRAFAKKIAIAFKSRYIARGKKSIDSLVSFARRNGDSRICIFVEKDSLPAHLEFISVKPNETWVWEKEKVMINYDES